MDYLRESIILKGMEFRLESLVVIPENYMEVLGRPDRQPVSWSATLEYHNVLGMSLKADGEAETPWKSIMAANDSLDAKIKAASKSSKKE